MIFNTLGGPRDASLQALAEEAGRRFAAMFKIAAEYDNRLDAVVLDFRHGNTSYRQAISRDVFGEPSKRSSAIQSPADVSSIAHMEVTQWAVAEAVRNIAAQMGPVDHIKGRMEAAESKVIELGNNVAMFKALAESRGNTIDYLHNEQRRLLAYWALPWYKRVWRAWRGDSGME